ncbi:hypothetical protein P3X46_016285 [Hevea brasiliensis]|uniref:Uncharacterized protein n=1 Tax=Hevea brasiliensis TaxID=3981 RepID=A0ABQ9LYM3_HEVBR|nr:protein GLUTAMINE DUMPER 5-like [Hevea brasiliensis]KAJ9173119.1 hypothetical protein P3X46_016285 [Hevea brasiliensis]
MRPASNSTTGGAGAGFWHFNSPMPYLFGGLALMLGIITFALIILACSWRNSSNSATQVPEEKSVKQVDDSEPKIAVIMAGDKNPTFLAKPKPKPVSCICHNEEQV